MGISKEEVCDRLNEARLHPPKTLTLMITRSCNLQCAHCLLDCRPEIPPHAVPSGALYRIIRGFVRVGGEEILLTGGEPLLHPDWPAILSFACRQPELKEVGLQTNATLLTEAHVARLRAFDCGKLTFQVSIEGATAQTNDRVRGTESFERIIAGLRLLAEAGLADRIRVAFTEMQHNMEELPLVLELVEQLKIGRLVSGTLVPGGRAASGNELLPPTPDQYTRLLRSYTTDSRFASRYRERANISAIEWYRWRSEPSNHACSCVATPFINADGRFYPCVMLLCEEYSVLGAHDRSLEEMLLEGASLWAELPRINRQRRDELETCRHCPGKVHCNGGCMGRAYAAHGDFMFVEDRCALRQAVYAFNDLKPSDPFVGDP